jgi:ribosome-associated protein
LIAKGFIANELRRFWLCPAPPPATMSRMAVTPKKLLDIVTVALDDGKAEDIKVFDVRKLTSIADFMVVASGRSSRQVKALAERAADAARKRKVKPLGMEGEQTSEWVLLDLGDVIVHVMQPESRAHYQLEKLWDAGPPITPVLSAPKAKPKTRARAEAAPLAPAKPAAAPTRAATGARAKPAATTGTTKKVGAKKAVAKKAVAKKAVARKAPAAAKRPRATAKPAV